MGTQKAFSDKARMTAPLKHAGVRVFEKATTEKDA